MSGPPSYVEGKLLGVPTIENSSGTMQAQASMDLHVSSAWELQDNIKALVFDTTAGNSGIGKGAAKLLQAKLQRKVFYLACRHHIMEIIVGAVWEELFGKVKAPENLWFKKLKDAWPNICTENPSKLNVSPTWLQTMKENSKQMLQKILKSEKIPREDYRELAELTLIILGETPPRGIHWRRPGAIHQARWMARNLYVLKMFMFADQMKYDSVTKQKLERIKFSCIVLQTQVDDGNCSC